MKRSRWDYDIIVRDIDSCLTGYPNGSAGRSRKYNHKRSESTLRARRLPTTVV